jgi:glycosyltransferase involved in cell wall biosynthesis
MEPIVSFVVPCYNYGRFVRQAVGSLLDQTFEALEVIVIDNASTDNSSQVLEQYDDHPRVRVIRRQKNLGHVASLNEGFRLARGRLIGVMDADDFCVRADAVARQVAVFDEHPEVGLVYSALSIVDENGRQFRELRPADADRVRSGFDEMSELILRNYIHHSGTLIRRQCHAELGEYDRRLPHSCDWDRWLRIAARHSIAYLSEPLYAYRMHGTNMHHTKISPSDMNGQYLLTVRKAFQALPADAPAWLRQMEPRAVRRALLNSTWGDRSLGRTRRSWAGLFDAARRSPSMLVNAEFHGHLARLVLLTALGHRRYVQLSMWQQGMHQIESAGAAAGA